MAFFADNFSGATIRELIDRCTKFDFTELVTQAEMFRSATMSMDEYWECVDREVARLGNVWSSSEEKRKSKRNGDTKGTNVEESFQFPGSPKYPQSPGWPMDPGSPGSLMPFEGPGSPTAPESPGSPMINESPVRPESPGSPMILESPGSPLILESPGSPVPAVPSGPPVPLESREPPGPRVFPGAFESAGATTEKQETSDSTS